MPESSQRWKPGARKASRRNRSDLVGGSAASFPGTREAERLPENNLPAELSSFVGRQREVAEVEELLLADRRLLTLTGTGGSGKTRLALAVASDVAEGFEDGVWWVELAPLSDPELVPQATASALSVREQSGVSLIETLADALREKRLLLVLDNCEHLIEGCALFAQAMLLSCPRLRILATSREALGVAGEVNWRVPSLAVPDTERPPSYRGRGALRGGGALRGAGQLEAVELLSDQWERSSGGRGVPEAGRDPSGHRTGGRQGEGVVGEADRREAEELSEALDRGKPDGASSPPDAQGDPGVELRAAE